MKQNEKKIIEQSEEFSNQTLIFATEILKFSYLTKNI